MNYACCIQIHHNTFQGIKYEYICQTKNLYTYTNEKLYLQNGAKTMHYTTELSFYAHSFYLFPTESF